MTNKKRLILIAAVILSVAAGFFLLRSVLSPERKIAQIMTRYTFDTQIMDLDEALLRDGRLTEGSCAAISRAMDRYDAGSDEAVRLAIYAVIRVPHGYPEEEARRRLTEQAAAIDPSKYYGSGTLETLFREAPWALDLLFDRYARADGHSARSMLNTIAKNSGGLPLTRRVEMALSVENKDLTALEFLTASLTEDDLPGLRAMLTLSTDPEQLSLCAQALAEQPNQPEDIVPILAHLRQQGVSVAELFPQGIRLNTDLSPLNRSDGIPEGGDPLPPDSRFLIISRTEGEVKAEELSAQPDDGYSCHNKEDPSTFDVRLETAWMDRTHPEQMPETYADCEWFVVLDQQYVCGGFLTDLRDYATGHTEYGRYFYPIYGSLSRLVLVERDGLVPRRLIASQSVEAETDQTVARWTNATTGASISTYRPAQRFDGAWKDEALRSFLDRE